MQTNIYSWFKSLTTTLSLFLSSWFSSLTFVLVIAIQQSLGDTRFGSLLCAQDRRRERRIWWNSGELTSSVIPNHHRWRAQTQGSAREGEGGRESGTTTKPEPKEVKQNVATTPPCTLLFKRFIYLLAYPFVIECKAQMSTSHAKLLPCLVSGRVFVWLLPLWLAGVNARAKNASYFLQAISYFLISRCDKLCYYLGKGSSSSSFRRLETQRDGAFLCAVNVWRDGAATRLV